MMVCQANRGSLQDSQVCPTNSAPVDDPMRKLFAPLGMGRHKIKTRVSVLEGNTTMEIRLTKGKDSQPGALTCVRADGSCTWQRSSHYFAYHDLIHYAVETTLGYQHAFLGLVAQGKDLDAFGTKSGVKDTYTPEEGWAESLVGLLQWPSVGGGPALSDVKLMEMLVKTCTDQGMPAPSITPEQLAQIRAQIRALHQKWEQLLPGETLKLAF